jgi:hypothetical protein
VGGGGGGGTGVLVGTTFAWVGSGKGVLNSTVGWSVWAVSSAGPHAARSNPTIAVKINNLFIGNFLLFSQLAGNK